jgi:L-amino acid N-acyltransferase
MDVIAIGREYSDQILEIFNEAILNTTALFDYKPRTRGYIKTWFDDKEAEGFPLMGIIGHGDELLAFGTYGPFRRWPAYRYSVEHSLYVKWNHRGRGLGKLVLRSIIDSAEKKDYHTLIAGICSENIQSIEMHKKIGFVFAGEVRQAGYKFGRWLDLDFYQLLFPTPLNPKEE